MGKLKSRGFTLLEIMVVLVIISVILTFTTLSLGDGGQLRRIEKTSQRLQAVIQLAQQEAIIKGSELGLVITTESYQFVRFTGQTWETLHHDSIFNKHLFPLNTQLFLTVEGEEMSIFKESKKTTPSTKNAPHLIFFSSGEITPFTLILHNDTLAQHGYQLTGDFMGQLNLTSYAR